MSISYSEFWMQKRANKVARESINAYNSQTANRETALESCIESATVVAMKDFYNHFTTIEIQKEFALSKLTKTELEILGLTNGAT